MTIYFNPRSHKGSDGYRQQPSSVRKNHFNPRSHKGSDTIWQKRQEFGVDFNPRSHKGSDNNESINGPYISISIHAPTRGATAKWMSTANTTLTFQSTLPQGERRDMVDIWERRSQFQSTLPQGERLLWIALNVNQKDFNPRSHKGSDPTKYLSLRQLTISIHAPTRGATMINYSIKYSLTFQSTLPQGERRVLPLQT